MHAKQHQRNQSILVAVTLFLGIALAPSLVNSAEPLDPYQQQVQDLYIAIYGRPGDLVGLDYWADRLAEASGLWTPELIDEFANSTEYLDRYASLPDAALITTIFNQLFNRSPDQAGMGYYEDLLAGTNTSGLNPALRQATRSQVALDILYGAVGNDLQALENKVEVAEYFTQLLLDIDRTYSGSDLSAATDLLAVVGTTTESIEEGQMRAQALAEKAEQPNFQTAHLTRPYYQRFHEFGKTLDDTLAQWPELQPISAQGGFPTSVMNTLTKVGHELFLGFSTGQVVRILFGGGIDEFEQILEVSVLNQDSRWERAITALAYDHENSFLYAGLGTRSHYSERFRASPLEWLILDFSRMVEQNFSESGGGIMRYSQNNQQWVEFHPNLVGQGTILSLSPFAMEDGKQYLAAHWGPYKAPQSVYIGVDLIDVGAPVPVPIPAISGSEIPDGTYPVVKYFDATPGQGGLGGIKEMFNPTLGEPTASAAGRHSDRLYYAGYANGSIWVRDAVYADGLGTFHEINPPVWGKIGSLTYTEFDGRSYLFAGNTDATVQLLRLDANGSILWHREIHKNIVRYPLTYCTDGPSICWNPVKDVQLSVDGKEAAVLFYSDVQWSPPYDAAVVPDGAIRLFSFEHERWLGELLLEPDAGLDSHLRKVTAVSQPYRVPGEDSVYKIFVGRVNGAVQEYDYRAKDSGELEVVASRELRTQGTSTGFCTDSSYPFVFWPPSLGFVPLRVPSVYRVNDFDFDGQKLIAYTDFLPARVLRDVVNTTVTAGMGIDLYSWSGGVWGEGSGSWTPISLQKVSKPGSSASCLAVLPEEG